jgi:hypothetical protein
MVLIASALNIGCNKEEQWLDAVILDLGSPAVDGCGFVLEIGDKIYYPINLEEKYQIGGKTVKVRYSVLEEIHPCGFPHSEIKYQKINIKKIKDR